MLNMVLSNHDFKNTMVFKLLRSVPLNLYLKWLLNICCYGSDGGQHQ